MEEKYLHLTSKTSADLLGGLSVLVSLRWRRAGMRHSQFIVWYDERLRPRRRRDAGFDGHDYRVGSCDPSANGYQAMKDSIPGPTGGQLTETGLDSNGNVTWAHTNRRINDVQIIHVIQEQF